MDVILLKNKRFFAKLKPMDLKLERKDYEALVEILKVGLLLLEDLKTDENKELDGLINRGELLLSQILNHGPKHGFKKYLLKNRDGGYELGEDYLEKIFDNYFFEFENLIFWESLSRKLAQRDLLRIHQRKVLKAMSDPEKLSRLFKLQDTYSSEFKNNGLDRIFVESDFEDKEEMA